MSTAQMPNRIPDQMSTKMPTKMPIIKALLSALTFVSLTTASITACAPSSNQPLTNETGAGLRATETLVNEDGLTVKGPNGRPIAGARVLIGTRENVPFPGNVVTTDSAGRIPLPSAWTDAQPVTIEARGFVRATWFGRTADAPEGFVLRRAVPSRTGGPAAGRPELKGETQGFGRLVRDGFVDVGLVFPAITRAQINTIQVASLISPQTDTISVVGRQIEIPSNVTLPEQTESYVLPITLRKPAFRVYAPEAGNYRMVATHAKFPLKDVVDELRGGKSFFDVINKIEFLAAGFKDVAIDKPTQTTNLVVNEVPFVPRFKIGAPNFDANQAMLALSLPERGGLYHVADVKRLAPRETLTLKAPQNSSGLVVAVLKKNDKESNSTVGAAAEAMSVAIHPSNRIPDIQFVTTPDAPKVRASTLVLDPPRTPSGLSAILTYAVLSKVEVVESGNIKLENKTPEWELYADAWAQNLELPELPGAPRPQGGWRWEVTFGGMKPDGRTTAGPGALEKVSHVARSAVDL